MPETLPAPTLDLALEKAKEEAIRDLRRHGFEPDVWLEVGSYWSGRQVVAAQYLGRRGKRVLVKFLDDAGTTHYRHVRDRDLTKTIPLR